MGHSFGGLPRLCPNNHGQSLLFILFMHTSSLSCVQSCTSAQLHFPRRSLNMIVILFLGSFQSVFSYVAEDAGVLRIVVYHVGKCCVVDLMYSLRVLCF